MEGGGHGMNALKYDREEVRLMNEIKGTPHKQSIFDDPKVCTGCGMMFYASTRYDRVYVICPYCGHKH